MLMSARKSTTAYGAGNTNRFTTELSAALGPSQPTNLFGKSSISTSPDRFTSKQNISPVKST